MQQTVCGPWCFPTAFMVDIFMHDSMASTGAPGAQLTQLVFRVLTFVVGAYSGVNRNAHGVAAYYRLFKCPFYAGFLVVRILPPIFFHGGLIVEYPNNGDPVMISKRPRRGCACSAPVRITEAPLSQGLLQSGCACAQDRRRKPYKTRGLLVYAARGASDDRCRKPLRHSGFLHFGRRRAFLYTTQTPRRARRFPDQGHGHLDSAIRIFGPPIGFLDGRPLVELLKNFLAIDFKNRRAVPAGRDARDYFTASFNAAVVSRHHGPISSGVKLRA